MASTARTKADPELRTCPACGETALGTPRRCSRCGTIMLEEVQAIQSQARSARGAVKARKNLSDAFFLFGLLVGGPLMASGGNHPTGLLVILGGGCASALYRYTTWSVLGAVLVGSLVALTAALLLFDPAIDLQEELAAGESARVAYMAGLTEQDPDVLADARGPGGVTGWFLVPSVMAKACGEYPPDSVRDHLRDLGFLRVVVSAPGQSGGVCTFAP